MHLGTTNNQKSTFGKFSASPTHGKEVRSRVQARASEVELSSMQEKGKLLDRRTVHLGTASQLSPPELESFQVPLQPCIGSSSGNIPPTLGTADAFQTTFAVCKIAHSQTKACSRDAGRLNRQAHNSSAPFLWRWRNCPNNSEHETSCFRRHANLQAENLWSGDQQGLCKS